MNKPLSYFVKYKELIDNINIDNDSERFTNTLSKTMSILSTDKNDINLFKKQYKTISNEISTFNKLLNDFKSDVEKELREKELHYLNKSQQLYDETNDEPEYIIKRFTKHKLITNKEHRKKLLHNISENCSWKHPGLIIRPGLCDLVDPLVSLDPLYVLDEHVLLFNTIKDKWNETFQGRIRYGIINDSEQVILRNIPKNQLGFVFVNDFFNYKPLDIIKKYTTEIFSVLKPGGTLLFTYNNCNYANAVKNFENVLYSYTPGTLVIAMLELIGFEISNTFDDPNSNLNWIEVKKPGVLTSLRGGQCLGKINV